MPKHEYNLSDLLNFDTAVVCRQVQLKLHSSAYDGIMAGEEKVGISYYGEKNFLMGYWIWSPSALDVIFGASFVVVGEDSVVAVGVLAEWTI